MGGRESDEEEQKVKARANGAQEGGLAAGTKEANEEKRRSKVHYYVNHNYP